MWRFLTVLVHTVSDNVTSVAEVLFSMTALIAKTFGEMFQIQSQQPSLFEKEIGSLLLKNNF